MRPVISHSLVKITAELAEILGIELHEGKEEIPCEDVFDSRIVAHPHIDVGGELATCVRFYASSIRVQAVFLKTPNKI